MLRPFPRTAFAAALLGLAAACGLSGCASPPVPELRVGLDKGRMHGTLRARYGGRLRTAEVAERVREAEEAADETLLTVVRARLARLDGTEGVTLAREEDGFVRVRFPDGAAPEAAERAAHALALRGDVSVEALFPPDDPYPARILEDCGDPQTGGSPVPRGFRFVDDPVPPFARRRLVLADAETPETDPDLHVPTGMPAGSWHWRFVPARAPDGSLSFRPARTFQVGRKDLLVAEARCEPAEEKNGGWRVLARLDPASARETDADNLLRRLGHEARGMVSDADGKVRLAAVFAPYALPDVAVLTNGAARTLVLSGFANRRDAEFVAGLLSDGPLPAPVLVERVGAWVAPRANPPQAP